MSMEVGQRRRWIGAAPWLCLLLDLCGRVGAQTQWVPRPSGATTNQFGVAYGSGIFLTTVGCRSTDGVTWSATPCPSTARAIAYGNNVFVGGGSYYLWSTNDGGSSYATRVDIGGAFYGIAYGNGLFVAVGSSGLIKLSKDSGVTWTDALTPTSSDITSICFGDGIFMIPVAGSVATSSDGYFWTLQQSAAAPAYSVSPLSYGKGAFVELTGATVYFSYDKGVTWTKNTVTPTLSNLQQFAYANNTYVAVGSYGSIWTSLDAITWVKQNSGTAISRYGISYALGTWVSVGENGSIVTSSATSVQSTLVPSVQIAPSVTLQWATQTGLFYQVQSSPEVNLGPWTNVGALISGDGQPKSYNDLTGNAAQKFYRVQVK